MNYRAGCGGWLGVLMDKDLSQANVVFLLNLMLTHIPDMLAGSGVENRERNRPKAYLERRSLGDPLWFQVGS